MWEDDVVDEIDEELVLALALSESQAAAEVICSLFVFPLSSTFSY